MLNFIIFFNNILVVDQFLLTPRHGQPAAKESHFFLHQITQHLSPLASDIDLHLTRDIKKQYSQMGLLTSNGKTMLHDLQNAGTKKTRASSVACTGIPPPATQTDPRLNP